MIIDWTNGIGRYISLLWVWTYTAGKAGKGFPAGSVFREPERKTEFIEDCRSNRFIANPTPRVNR